MTEPTNTPNEPINPAEKTYTQEEVNKLIEEKLSGIKANRDELLEEKKAKQREAEELAEQKKLAELEMARKNGDFQKIEEDLRRQLEEKNQALQELHNKTEMDKVKFKASEISEGLVVDSFKPYLKSDIEKRIFRDENGTWRFKDRDGNTTSMTVEEFKLSLKNEPAYKDFIIVSNSTGSGAIGGGFGGGAAKEAKDYTEQERRELKAKNPALFKQLFLSS